MKNSWIILMLILIFLLASLALTPVIEKSNIVGDWIGGFKVQEKWVFIDAHFKMEKGVITAKINLPFENETNLELTQICLKHSRIKFMLPNGSETLLFEGLCNGGTISGCVKNGSKDGIFHLFRVDKANSKR